MDKITKILQQYRILPQATRQITNRLTEVKANGKKYALKRSRLTKDSIKQWESVYHRASKQNLHEIIPVYFTQNRQLYVEYEDEYYYLMPWVEGGYRVSDENRVTAFYKSLGRIHVETKSYYELNKTKLASNFTTYKNDCLRDETRLLAWIERMEQTHYPSPMELQLLTYYRDLRFSLYRSQALVDRIIAMADDVREWGVSLNHGNLKRDHLFEHYIINWETPSYRHAVYDLVNLFANESVEEPHLQDDLIQKFPVYLEENPLTELEQCLFCLYLLNTNDYLYFIERHLYSTSRNRSHLQASMELEHYHRQLVLGLRMDAQMDELTKQKEN